MDKNMKWIKETKINKIIDELNKNNMDGYFVNSKEDLINKIDKLVEDGATVSCGGSMTLFETGVIDYLRSEKFNFLDRYEEGLSAADIKKIFIRSFSADAYFTSTNAITEKGELYNVDGNGNRVAAMLYGPEKVIVIVGINKIVKNIDEAIIRNERISAPANCKRLNKNTPCIQIGNCVNCSSIDRICNEYTVIKRQSNRGRIHVIFLNEELGY